MPYIKCLALALVCIGRSVMTALNYRFFSADFYLHSMALCMFVIYNNWKLYWQCVCIYIQGSFCALSSMGKNKRRRGSHWPSLSRHLLGVKSDGHEIGVIRGRTLPRVKLSPNNGNTSIFYGVDVHYFVCLSHPCKVTAIILTPQIKELKLQEVNSPFLSDRAWVEIHYSGFGFSALCNTVFMHSLIRSFTSLVIESATVCLVANMYHALC